IISNLDLDYMTSWGSFESPETFPAPQVTSYSAVEFYRLFPDARGKFRLGTAVRLNASFPLLSPAAELPTNPPRRVVDAGYYDNYGLIVASRWVERNGGWLAGQEIPIWVVQLWTYGYDAQSTSLVSGAEAGLLEADGSRSSVAPAQRLFAAWRANMAYRGEERLNQVLFALNFDRFYAGKPLLAYRFRKDIGKVDLPMNWVLTGYELAQIEANGKEF